MFRIYSNDNKLLGLTDKLSYVRKGTNDCLMLCEESQAQGIVYNGEVYGLNGVDALADKTTVYTEEVDTAVELDRTSATTSITFVSLAESGAIDDVTAMEHADLFTEWAYPIAYKTGQIRRFKGCLYRCVQDHTSQADWTPDVTASLWAFTADPAEEWPEWSQPVGAHDAYAQGDKVTHADKKWTSDVDANVWEPGVYGWTEYTESV